MGGVLRYEAQKCEVPSYDGMGARTYGSTGMQPHGNTKHQKYENAGHGNAARVTARYEGARCLQGGTLANVSPYDGLTSTSSVSCTAARGGAKEIVICVLFLGTPCEIRARQAGRQAGRQADRQTDRHTTGRERTR